MVCFLHAKTRQNITMTHNIGAKHTGNATERAVPSGNQCRDGMMGQGLEPLEERTLCLLALAAQVLKGSLSACRTSVIRGSV